MKKLIYLATWLLAASLQAQQQTQVSSQCLAIEQQLRLSHQLVPNVPFAYFDTAARKAMFYNSNTGLHEMYPQPDLNRTSLPRVSSFGVNPSNNFALTKDINTAKDANPSNYDFTNSPAFAVMNNVSYYAADNGINGVELWRSNGTPAGTFMVKDISPGESSSSPLDIVTSGNHIFFGATTPTEGSELWTSDGTTAGTHIVADIQPGVSGSNPIRMTSMNGRIFFVSGNQYYNNQLWESDGTAAGTVVVKDLYINGLQTYDIGQLTPVGNLLFFTAFSASTGYELFRSDGTAAGTYRVKEINAANGYDNGPSQLTAYKNKLYFSADDGSGRVLWVSDGTAANTQPAPGNNGVLLPPGYNFASTPFTISNNKLFFPGYTAASGWELCKYEGPAHGAVLVKNITLGAANTVLSQSQIADINNEVYLMFADSNLIVHLWKSNGNPPGTVEILNLGKVGFYTMFNAGGKLLFEVRTDSTGYEPWISDGTTAGTRMIKNIFAGPTSSSPYNFTNCNGSVLFRASNAANGIELWKTDGTEAGTSLVLDANKTTTSSSNSFQLVALNNIVLFPAYKATTGTELWKSDGSAAGTTIIKDILPGENSGYPNFLTKKNNLAYFNYYNGQANSVYRTDGTAAGTTEVVSTPANNYANGYKVTDNGTVFYFIYNSVNGKYSLWKTDGTPSGTRLLKDKLGISYQGYDYIKNKFYNLESIGNTIYFYASDDSTAYGSELWKSDGTVAGTKMVKDINPGPESSNAYNDMIVYKNKLYFRAYDGSIYTIWSSDGTPGGTARLKGVDGYNFCISNNTLFFTAFTFTAGYELWKSDGTTAGTRIVKDIYKGNNSSYPNSLTDVNGVLFFTATDSAHGAEFWKSDGTAANTKLVKDITPGGSYSYIYYLASSAGKLFFVKDNYLWVSDGTVAGTHQVDDAGLANVTYINNLQAAGDMLFFTGYSYQYGSELYAGNTSTLTFARSEMISKIAAPERFTAELVTNPVQNQMTIKVNAKNEQSAQILITDMGGRKMLNSNLSLSSGVNMLNYNTSSWQHGLYMVTIICSDGSTNTLKAMK